MNKFDYVEMELQLSAKKCGDGVCDIDVDNIRIFGQEFDIKELGMLGKYIAEFDNGENWND